MSDPETLAQVIERGWIEAQQVLKRSFAQLADVGADSQAMLLRRLKNLLRLSSSERAFVGEYVDKLRQLAFGGSWNHLLTDEIDILFAAFLKFLGNNVRAEESAYHRAGPLAGGLLDGCERFKLGFQAEAVTGFGFDRGRSLRSHLLEGVENFSCQLALPCFTHGFYAGANSAAGFGNLFIGCTGSSLFEVDETRIDESGMRVGIDEAGKDDFSLAVNFGDLFAAFLEPGVFQRVFGSADRDNLAAKAKDGGVFEDAKIAEGRAASRSSRGGAQREELTDIDQQKGTRILRRFLADAQVK